MVTPKRNFHANNKRFTVFVRDLAPASPKIIANCEIEISTLIAIRPETKATRICENWWCHKLRTIWTKRAIFGPSQSVDGANDLTDL
jgi:hypothetical protein